MGTFNCGWESLVELPDLSENQVHVWKVCIADFYKRVKAFEQLLNETEKKRACQFKFKDSRLNFIICRGILRFLLSRYLYEDPKSVGIMQDPEGKPELAADSHQHALKFNLSHSNEICLIALSRNLDLGIDVEEKKPLADLDDMAKSFLTEREFTIFLSCPPGDKLTLFYNLWSAKEAVLKAMGCGLMIQPNQIEIDAIRKKKEFTVQYRSKLIEMTQIEMISLDRLDGYAAWLVIAGKVEKIRKLQLSRPLIVF
jgi:4'-phosphopantetheinyl transferase